MKKEFFIDENGIFLGFSVNDGRLRFFADKKLFDLRDKVQSDVPFSVYEIKTAGGVCGCRGERSCYSDVALNAKYVKHTVEKNNFGTLLTIKTETDDLAIDTYYQLYDGIAVFSVYHEIFNISEKDVVLEYVSGACIYGWALDIDVERRYPGLELPIIGASRYRDVDIYSAHSGWGREYMWRKHSAYDVGLTDDRNCFDRYTVGDTGSWTTKRYFPAMILSDKKTGEFLYCEEETRGSWEIETSGAGNVMYLTSSSASYQRGWAHKLAPGESYLSAKSTVARAVSQDGVLQEITKYRRRVSRKNTANRDMPIVYNTYMKYDWDYPEEKSVVAAAKVAAELGAEYFCIDAGWHDDERNFHEYLGSWEETKRTFPNGLKNTIDKIKSFGFEKVGLWFEIESVGKNYKKLSQLPKEWFFYRNGFPVIEGDKLQLDFSNGEVYEHAMRVVSETVEKYGVDYIKIDYNHDAGPGTEIGSFSLGDGLEKHTLAFRRWAEELMKKYPKLVVETCASGAMRSDPATLSLFPLTSISDQTIKEKMAYIAAAMPSLVLPEKCLIWLYPEREERDEIIFNCVSALLARPCFAGAIPHFGKTGRAIMKEFSSYYEKIKALKAEALPFWPNGLPYGDEPYVCVGLKKGCNGLLFVWNISADAPVKISLKECIAAKVCFPSDSRLQFICENEELRIEFSGVSQAAVFELAFHD